MFYPVVRKYHASNTSCVCNRFLEFLQSGFYTASLPARFDFQTPFSQKYDEFLRPHQKPSLLLFLQTGKILTLSASNFKKNVHSSLQPPNTSACHFTDLNWPPNLENLFPTERFWIRCERRWLRPAFLLLLLFFFFFFNPKWRGSGEREGIRTDS